VTQLSAVEKVFLKDIISYNSLAYLLKRVTSPSTVDHSTLLPYGIRVGFIDLEEKSLIYFDIVIRD
jgi:hypothetical protein